MSWWRRQAVGRHRLGRRSEQFARQALAAEGYVVEEANVRFPVGEIDLVARDGETLCFIEVRSTSSAEWGGALATVTRPKQRRIARAAQWYLARRGEEPAAIRFDVVAVGWGPDGKPTAELVRGAFDADVLGRRSW